jgi:hypothetical protein
MAKKLSKHAQQLWLSGTHELRKRLEREAAAMPNADVAQKMYGPLNAPLLPDATRGAVSPLNGVAVAQPTKEKHR